MRVGDSLVSLQQGGHRSSESGNYLGNGEYQIQMKGAGGDGYFLMHFQLVAQGGGKFELRRIDCNDPPTMLTSVGDHVLKGDVYTLNFA